jgi:hypothetical protein
MKQITMKQMTIASLVVMCLLAVCTFDDLLSLHDIKADYVSTSVFRYSKMPIPEGLPPWTATSLEWTSITVTFVLRSLLIAANLVILSILYGRVRKPPDTEEERVLP